MLTSEILHTLLHAFCAIFPAHPLVSTEEKPLKSLQLSNKMLPYRHLGLCFSSILWGRDFDLTCPSNMLLKILPKTLEEERMQENLLHACLYLYLQTNSIYSGSMRGMEAPFFFLLLTCCVLSLLKQTQTDFYNVFGTCMKRKHEASGRRGAASCLACGWGLGRPASFSSPPLSL